MRPDTDIPLANPLYDDGCILEIRTQYRHLPQSSYMIQNVANNQDASVTIWCGYNIFSKLLSIANQQWADG